MRAQSAHPSRRSRASLAPAAPRHAYTRRVPGAGRLATADDRVEGVDKSLQARDIRFTDTCPQVVLETVQDLRYSPRWWPA